MQGHILSHLIEDDFSSPEFPFLCLTVSGGHTQIVYVEKPLKMTVLASTIDDAVGEAFDKAGKAMDLGYPAGPIIDRLAQKGDANKYKFTFPKVSGYNYSFSGEIKPFFKTSETEHGVDYESYSDSENILDMQFMGDKVLVLRNVSDNLNVDIFNFDDLNHANMKESTLDSDSTAGHVTKSFMRVLTDTVLDSNGDVSSITNYGLISYITNPPNNHFNLYSFVEGQTSNLVQTNITDITGVHTFENIVDLLVFDKDNIFVVGNKGTAGSLEGKILKLSFNTTTKLFTQVVTIQTILSTENNILYAEKYIHEYQVGENTVVDRYIIVFYEEGTNATSGFSFRFYKLDTTAGGVFVTSPLTIKFE